MAELLNFINNLLWDSLLIYLLLGTGIWFTLRTGFIQIRHFCHTFTILKDLGTRGGGGISPFQALCTSLAVRIGCGNLMGVAIALILGGPGAIFWMWLAALIGMATAFAESTLAQLYKIRDTCGGPAWYMANGLGLRWMGTLFTLFLLAGYGGFFSAVQANAITLSAQQLSGMGRWPITLALLILCAAAIFGGLRAIARLTQWLVPAMGLLYLLLAGWVVLHHWHQIAAVAALVFNSAFGLPVAASGLVGYGLAQAIFQGVQRGLFSNEAGTGSAPNIAAAAAPWPPHPASQGYIQMLAVFIRHTGDMQRHGGDYPHFRHARTRARRYSRHRVDLSIAGHGDGALEHAATDGAGVCVLLRRHYWQLRLCGEQPALFRATTGEAEMAAASVDA